MIKAVLITGSTAMVVGFSGTLLTLIGPNTLPALPAQYVKFAILLLLFAAPVRCHPDRVILIRDGAERKER
jgi:hypothetical protein